MRLSSSSAEIATASTSRSVKSAKFFTAVAPLYQFRMILNCYKGWIGVGQTEKLVRVPVLRNNILSAEVYAGASLPRTCDMELLRTASVRVPEGSMQRSPDG